GPEGAGIMYIRRELQDDIPPLVMGWMNVVNEQDFSHIDFTLKPNAKRYDSGAKNTGGFLGLKQSLELLQNIGVENVAERRRVLSGRMLDGAVRKGYQPISPREEGASSVTASFTTDKIDLKAFVQKLRKEH